MSKPWASSSRPSASGEAKKNRSASPGKFPFQPRSLSPGAKQSYGAQGKGRDKPSHSRPHSAGTGSNPRGVSSGDPRPVKPDAGRSTGWDHRRVKPDAGSSSSGDPRRAKPDAKSGKKYTPKKDAKVDPEVCTAFEMPNTLFGVQFVFCAYGMRIPIICGLRAYILM